MHYNVFRTRIRARGRVRLSVFGAAFAVGLLMAHTPRLHLPRREEHHLALSAKLRTEIPSLTIKLEQYLGNDWGSTLLSLLTFAFVGTRFTRTDTFPRGGSGLAAIGTKPCGLSTNANLLLHDIVLIIGYGPAFQGTALRLPQFSAKLLAVVSGSALGNDHEILHLSVTSFTMRALLCY